MDKILIAILFLSLEIILLWDFINQLAGLNEDLNDNNCKWKRKKIKYLQMFFPKVDKRRNFKKVTPEHLFCIVFGFQMTLYFLFLSSLINSILCLVLYFISIEFNVMYYWIVFTFIILIIMCVILSISYYIVHKECRSISNTWSDFN